MRFLLAFLMPVALLAQPSLDNPLIGAFANRTAAAAGYTYTATKFDGANDWLSRAEYTGEADGKLLTVSFWFKVNSGDGVARVLYRDAGNIVLIVLQTDNTILIFGEDVAFGFTGRFNTSSTFAAGSTWHHFIVSWDLTDSGKRHVYVDGSADGGTWLSYNNANTDYANGGDQGVCASAAGADKAPVSLCEFYLHEAAYIDLSQASNLQKFRSAGGKPVSLGSDGSTPTGTQPIVYLKNAFGTFQNNLGSGGNFTVHGALEDDAAIP